MLLPIGQKPLDENNFKLLIKYVAAGEQRRRRQPFLFCKQAGRKLVLPAFQSQHNHQHNHKNIVFHFKWVWKNHLKTRAVQSLVGEKLLKGMKPPIEQALFINVE